MERLLAAGVKVSRFDLAQADIGEVARELVDSRRIVLGATMLGECTRSGSTPPTW